MSTSNNRHIHPKVLLLVELFNTGEKKKKNQTNVTVHTIFLLTSLKKKKKNHGFHVCHWCSSFSIKQEFITIAIKHTHTTHYQISNSPEKSKENEYD